MNRFKALRILGLGPEATLHEAKHAYREQVKLWHPDRYSDNSVLKSMALKNVQDANRAWAYLRARLPQSAPAPKKPAERSRVRRRSQSPPEFVIPSTRKMALNEMLRQGVKKLRPLFVRIAELPFKGLAGWLRDDPNRDFRPWYRYSHDSGQASSNGREPSFGRTLEEVMNKPGTGQRPPISMARRPGKTRLAAPANLAPKSEYRDGETIGAIDPVKRPRKS
jgi:curved DNA-binding protein CbpA